MSEQNKMTLNSWLTARVSSKGYRLVAVLKQVGISRQTYYDLVGERKFISKDKLDRLLSVLGVVECSPEEVEIYEIYLNARMASEEGHQQKIVTDTAEITWAVCERNQTVRARILAEYGIVEEPKSDEQIAEVETAPSRAFEPA